MKKLSYTATCSCCGHRFAFDIDRPTKVMSTVAKATCPKCRYGFVFTCSIDKKKDNPLTVIEGAGIH